MACVATSCMLMGTQNSTGRIKTHYHVPFLAADVLLAVSAIVIGILSLTLSSFPVALSATVSWGMIAGASGLLLTPLLVLAVVAKKKALPNKNCCFEDASS